MEFTHHYDSPIGSITLASDGKAITGLWFDDQKYYADTLDIDHEEKPLPVFDDADKWLDTYFSGRDPGFTLPLAPRGTDFRKEVWKILEEIPYGKTVTYGQIADRITASRKSGKTSARAVGSAVGKNPISLIVPCHRVIGSDGCLTGYAGGVDKKRWLLEKEGIKVSV